MWSRQELKARGMQAFKANYWMCVAATLILGAVAGASGGAGGRATGNNTDASEAISSLTENLTPEIIIAAVAILASVVMVALVIGTAWNVFVRNIIVLGGVNFFTKNSDGPAALGEIVAGFKNGYGNNCLVMFMKDLFIWLWSLLFVIPGIIKHYEYYMVPYILADNPGISWKDAIDESRSMMNGNKWNTFVLELSFIGWWILTVCTCGILGIFYVGPYVNATKAELYKELRG